MTDQTLETKCCCFEHIGKKCQFTDSITSPLRIKEYEGDFYCPFHLPPDGWSTWQSQVQPNSFGDILAAYKQQLEQSLIKVNASGVLNLCGLTVPNSINMGDLFNKIPKNIYKIILSEARFDNCAIRCMRFIQLDLSGAKGTHLVISGNYAKLILQSIDIKTLRFESLKLGEDQGFKNAISPHVNKLANAREEKNIAINHNSFNTLISGTVNTISYHNSGPDTSSLLLLDIQSRLIEFKCFGQTKLMIGSTANIGTLTFASIDGVNSTLDSLTIKADAKIADLQIRSTIFNEVVEISGACLGRTPLVNKSEFIKTLVCDKLNIKKFSPSGSSTDNDFLKEEDNRCFEWAKLMGEKGNRAEEGYFMAKKHRYELLRKHPSCIRRFFSISGWYWGLSNYGTNYWTGFAWVFFFIALTSLLDAAMTTTINPSVSIDWSAILNGFVFTVQQVTKPFNAFFFESSVTQGYRLFLSVIFTPLILTSLALALLAIRWRFKRD